MLIRPISARYMHEKEIDNLNAKIELKPFPVFASDEEPEECVATADLNECDFSGFKTVHFEFKPKTATIGMRVPVELLEVVKARAEREGMPYQRFIRHTLEQALAMPDKKRA